MERKNFQFSIVNSQLSSELARLSTYGAQELSINKALHSKSVAIQSESTDNALAGW